MHLSRHRARHGPRRFLLRPEAVAPNPISAEFDDRQAVPDHAFLIPQDRDLAERRGELVALTALLPCLIEQRDDQLLEFQPGLLERQPAAHRPAAIGPVADNQLHEITASRIAVLNSAIPFPVSLDVGRMSGWAAGCFAASTRIASMVFSSSVGFTLSALVRTR